MSKKSKQVAQQLPSLPTASSILIVLPQILEQSFAQMDQLLLQHYIKAKLMQKKKITLKESVSIFIFGREQNVIIDNVQIKDNQKQDNAQDKQKQEGVEKSKSFWMSVKTQINLTFQKDKMQASMKQKQNENFIKFYGENLQYQNFKNTIIQNFRLRQRLNKVKLGTLKGIILSGPSGTGKTTFIRKLKQQLQNSPQKLLDLETKIYFLQISSTQLLSRVVGGAQEYVRKIFQTLKSHPYSILVIEDMHLIFGEKELSAHETTLATLFSQMQKYANDKISESRALMVIGTYNSQRDLNKIVYQSGYFQKQISLNLPNHQQRLKILLKMFEQLQLAKQFSEDEIKQFNLRINGYSIGEMKNILRDAYILKGENIDKQLLLEILKQYRPSEIKDLIVEVPEVFWSGIGGYEDVKKQIRKVTQLPLKFPQKFQKLGIQPSKGVLLYGPPGCSKTMMAKAIATQSKLNFIGIKGPELFSKYVGQSQRAIRNVFRRARAFSPCIIFFDQIDALASQRNSQHNDVTNRLLGQLLTEMDGVEGLKDVVIIAATNRPQILDEALTRPGRFDHLIYVGPPDFVARKQIFKICLKKTPFSGDKDKIIQQMAERTDNYTGAEITLLCRQAALNALQQNIENPVVEQKHLNKALLKVKSRLTSDSIHRYYSFKEKFSYKENESESTENLTSAFKNLKIGNKPFKF